jgi:SAM-dependent methyltransferase
MLRRFLAPLPVAGKTVLELGCGPGGNLEYLSANGPRQLIGVDISSSMLGLARERLGDKVTLLKTDGITLPLPDDSLDLAYTVTVLQHNVEDSHMRSMVAELARVSRGVIVLIEDVVGSKHPAIRGESWVARRLSDYEEAARAVGLRLQSAAVLQTKISRWGYVRLRRLFPAAAEGAQSSRLFRALVAGWVLTAQCFDDFFVDAEVTQMVFTP